MPTLNCVYFPSDQPARLLFDASRSNHKINDGHNKYNHHEWSKPTLEIFVFGIIGGGMNEDHVFTQNIDLFMVQATKR